MGKSVLKLLSINPTGPRQWFQRLKYRLRPKTRHIHRENWACAMVYSISAEKSCKKLDVHYQFSIKDRTQQILRQCSRCVETGEKQDVYRCDFGFTQHTPFLNSSSSKSRERAIRKLQNFELVCSRNTFEASYISQ